MRYTHNDKIGTDEMMSPGYVWYRCADYNLTDNTAGGVGYHVVYHPLRDGAEGVTDEMRADTREHYAMVKAQDEAARKEDRERYFAEEGKPVKQSAMSKLICKHCGTVCYGDCRA